MADGPDREARLDRAKAIRRLVLDHPVDFRKAGQWLDSEYSARAIATRERRRYRAERACWRRRQRARGARIAKLPPDQRNGLSSHEPGAPNTPGWLDRGYCLLLSPAQRLVMAISDITERDGERGTKTVWPKLPADYEHIAHRILMLEWLVTDHRAGDDDAPQITDIQKSPWEPNGRRWAGEAVREPWVLPDGQQGPPSSWDEWVGAAMTAVEEAQTNSLVPLTGTPRAIADCIEAEPGINSPGIEFKLSGTPHETTQEHIRRVVIKKLKPRGFSGPKEGRDGYYAPGS